MFGVPSTSPNSSLFYPLISSSNITSPFLQTTAMPATTSALPLAAPTIASPLLLPPPSYTDTLLQQITENIQNQNMQNMLNSAAATLTLQMAMSPDIARLAADTTAVSLNDSEELDQPLDLSVKKDPSRQNSEDASTSVARPSVIRNGYVNPPPTRTIEVKRSASSVSYRNSPEPDVTEHFKRSLSGKWPRRTTNYAHYTPPNLTSQSHQNLSTTCNGVGGNIDQLRSKSPKSNMKRLPPTVGTMRSNSLKVSNSARQAPIIVESEDKVEDHFRKALGDKYERLKNNQESMSSNSSNSSAATSSEK